MIIPEKHKEPQNKYVSGAVTLMICLMGYLVLAYTDVPEVESSRVYMREISELNITRITPQPEPEIREERDQPREAEEAPEEVEAEVVTEAPRRINVDEMMPEGLRVDLTVDRSARQPTRQQVQDTEPRSLRIEDSEIERLEGGMRTLADRSLASRRADRRTAGDPEIGAGIAAQNDIELTGGGGVVTGTGTTLSGPRGREGSEIGIEVGLRDLEDFGEDYSELEYNALVEWMKDNPKDLPAPVSRLMCESRCDPNFLTSRVPFYIGDRQFDLLLMVIEQQVEVHIFLVENLDATYLVDSRFREISNRLHTGGVEYMEGDIAQVDSRMRPADRESTEEFYSIFLSWWNSVRDEYEN